MTSLTLPFSGFRGFLAWLDENILFVLAGFLLAFIPLYPKIPLWSPIEQYIVRVRAEDFIILLTAIVWGIQVLRKKVKWYTPMFWFVLAYAIVGLVSTLVAIFVIKTVPLQPLHVGKTLLHYFRYLEYFSFFFIMFSAIKKRSQVIAAMVIFSLTVLAIGLYGYGQKYYYWPVYSTMNREFSKGIRLYLTQYARVQSTFAGHYDMAAYLVVTLPLILAIAYKTKSVKWKVLLHTSFWLGTWLILASASRAPYAAYLAAACLVIGLTALFQSSWKEKFVFFFTRMSLFSFGTVLMMYYFGTDMIDRLNNLVRNNPQLSSITNMANDKRKLVISDKMLAMLPTPQQVQDFLPKGHPPENGFSTDQIAEAVAAQVATPADQPPTPVGQTKPTPKPTPVPGQNVPGDVYVNVPEVIEIATVSATGEKIIIKQQRQRIYSECAQKTELSLCIRQETLWPRAVEGYLQNKLTGTGYATLTKENVDQFTEADSTDNNFLRVLGETGALGFLTFYGCVVLVLVSAAKNFTSSDRYKAGLSIGLFCGTIGLLLNAIYIDVFAASKVALTYWGLAGMLFGYMYLKDEPVLVSPIVSSAGFQTTTQTTVSATPNAFAAALAQREQTSTPPSSPEKVEEAEVVEITPLKEPKKKAQTAKKKKKK